MLLDIVDAGGRLRPQIGVTLWRLDKGDYHIVDPDAGRDATLATIGVRLRAGGRRLVMRVLGTNEELHTSAGLLRALEEAEQRARAEAAARRQVEEELVC